MIEVYVLLLVLSVLIRTMLMCEMRLTAACRSGPELSIYQTNMAANETSVRYLLVA